MTVAAKSGLSSLAEWCDKLESVTQEGNDYRSACPKHGGRSLIFFADPRTGRVVFDCKAGCEYSEVAVELRKLGIRLWGDSLEFRYDNADGTPAFLKIKYRKKDGTKHHFYKCFGGLGAASNHNSVRTKSRGKDGKCNRCGVGSPRMLYRLPELLAGIASGAEVWLCEGEKDADSVLANKGSRNLVATTTMNGVDDWSTEYRDAIAGAAGIVIVADNDRTLATGVNPGYRGAWKRYVSLSDFTNVRVVRAAEGKDAFDHFANGYDLDSFEEILPEELAKFVNPDTPTESLGSGDFLYTQSEYADRFVAQYGDRFRYIDSEDLWLYYDEGHWREDKYAAQIHFAEKLCRAILADTPELLSDGKRVNPNWKTAKERCGTSQIASICRLAGTKRPIVTTREKFDSDPFLINVKNGTYDLKARELREHRSSDMLTKICPYSYDPSATGPNFDDYFEEVQPSEHWREQILMFLGYSITGKYGDYAFVHVGSGGNGKTTLLKLATRVLGTYATGASWKILSNQADDTHETIFAKLERRRFVVVQMGGRSLSSEQLRTIVAEPDFEARGMNQDSRTIEATHTIHVAQNDPPPLKQLDASTRRRLIVVEWNTVIDDPDDSLPVRLANEGDYVLTSIIDAYSRWTPQSVDLEATKSYFGKNLTYAWLETSGELERDSESWLYMEEHLYAAFTRWCDSTGREPDNRTIFGRTLTGLGSQKDKRDLGDGRKTVRSGYRFTIR